MYAQLSKCNLWWKSIGNLNQNFGWSKPRQSMILSIACLVMLTCPSRLNNCNSKCKFTPKKETNPYQNLSCFFCLCHHSRHSVTLRVKQSRWVLSLSRRCCCCKILWCATPSLSASGRNGLYNTGTLQIHTQKLADPYGNFFFIAHTRLKRHNKFELLYKPKVLRKQSPFRPLKANKQRNKQTNQLINQVTS